MYGEGLIGAARGRSVRRQRESAGEALGQHHLEDVAGRDIFLRRQHPALVLGLRDVWRLEAGDWRLGIGALRSWL